MAERWDHYFCETEAGPIRIDLDLQWQDTAHPLAHLLSVRVLLTDPAADGQCSPAEAKQLLALEVALRAALQAHCAVAFVGKTTGEGACTWFFYCATDVGLLPLIETVFSQGAHQVLYQTEHDPDWAEYHEVLAPDADELLWMADRTAVAGLGAGPHTIAQAFHAPSAEAEAALTQALIAEGFELCSGPDGLRLSREEPAELAHLHGLRLALVEWAQTHGCTHLGWQKIAQE